MRDRIWGRGRSRAARERAVGTVRAAPAAPRAITPTAQCPRRRQPLERWNSNLRTDNREGTFARIRFERTFGRNALLLTQVAPSAAAGASRKDRGRDAFSRGKYSADASVPSSGRRGGQYSLIDEDRVPPLGSSASRLAGPVACPIENPLKPHTSKPMHTRVTDRYGMRSAGRRRVHRECRSTRVRGTRRGDG